MASSNYAHPDYDGPDWDACIDKAEVCIATGMQPSEYDGLTDIERAAFVVVINSTHEE